MADAKKMLLQIKLKCQDQNSHRFLWRDLHTYCTYTYTYTYHTAYLLGNTCHSLGQNTCHFLAQLTNTLHVKINSDDGISIEPS